MTVEAETQLVNPISHQPESYPEGVQIMGRVSELNLTEPLFIDLDNAISEETIELDAVEHEVQEVFRCETLDHATTFSVLRQTQKDGYIIRRRQKNTDASEQDPAYTDEFIKFRYQSDAEIGTPNSDDTLTLALDKERQILRVNKNGSQENAADMLILAPRQERSPKKLARRFESVHEQEKKARKRRNRFLALGFMAFFASHGPVDQALDAFHDPAPAVSELVETQAQQGGLGGTSLEEADTTRLVETNLQNTLSDLDGARYDEIRERAEAFRASYPEGSFLSAEQLDDLRNGLQDATSFEDVTSLMSPFLARYEISFQIDADQGGSLDQAKQLAKGIIDVLNIFPAQPITLENRLSDNQPTSANTQNLFRLNSIVMTTEGVGLHSGKYDSRVIFLNISKASQAIDLLSDSGTLASPSQQGTFAHELGHSVLHDMPLSSSFVEDDYSYLRAVIGFFGGAIDYRTTPSSYSLTNPEEERAEKYRELFTIGIEDPNNVIAFNSPFNKRLLESLAYFESVMPGFSDQLVEQTTLEHASDSSVPLIDGFYRYTVFSGLLLSLYVNRDKVSSKNILRRADLDGPDPGK